MKITTLKLFSAAAILTVIVLTPSSTRAQTAAATYKAKCVSCHGADGKGNPAVAKTLGVRDFTSPDVQKQTDAELTAVIQNGKNKMPAYAKSLQADQITGLVAYIRSLGK
jgi:mono/diheme cytochrome c family protein